MTKDDWAAQVARGVAREVRRYRDRQRPRMSVQRLADATAELGMEIPRSVLANFESGRRETVSVAEVLVLAAALNVSPIELISPVGFDKQTEMLPGRMMDPLSAMRWFAGELKLDATEAVTTLRSPEPGQESSTYLVEYHDELIHKLQMQEDEALRAIADASKDGADERAQDEARYRMNALYEWRSFIIEPLRRTRAKMRELGMEVPDLPGDLNLSESDERSRLAPEPAASEEWEPPVSAERKDRARPYARKIQQDRLRWKMQYAAQRPGVAFEDVPEPAGSELFSDDEQDARTWNERPDGVSAIEQIWLIAELRARRTEADKRDRSAGLQPADPHTQRTVPNGLLPQAPIRALAGHRPRPRRQAPHQDRQAQVRGQALGH